MPKKIILCLVVSIMAGCGESPEMTCSILNEMVLEVENDLAKQEISGPFNVDLVLREPEDTPRRFQTVYKSPDELTSEPDWQEKDYLRTYFTYTKPNYTGWLQCRRLALLHDRSGEHQEFLECTLEKAKSREDADEKFLRISTVLDQCADQLAMTSSIDADEMHSVYGPGFVKGEYKLIGKQHTSDTMKTSSLIWLKYSPLNKDKLVFHINAVKKVENMSEQGGIYK
ncbi:hypothetical protein [Kordiimonas sp. SCSIO 12610]|uniref:hypothetical protein n=1 Tax=Kordiimonas sp. SCSIO 12610 TaxID=2829597 RepID=UPI00210B15D8|nr:hypothetical protein [Kordiimonas sp. SCSIO 12610]UTW56205.1 hypothetical protein KFF44_04715 [Kordiimonas sp. SCSIO 12610]